MNEFYLLFYFFFFLITINQNGGYVRSDHVVGQEYTDPAELEQYLRIRMNEERCKLEVEKLKNSSKTSTVSSSPLSSSLSSSGAGSLISSSTQENNKLKCPIVFDGILCWGETQADSYAYQPCPEWFIGFENKKERAKRFCQANGTWTPKKNSNGTYTDYLPCIDDLDAKLLALIKETFWVNSVGFPKDIIADNSRTNRYVMNPNVTHWECKTMMALTRYAESSNHATVFSEALYLNALLSVSTFNDNQHFRFYIAIGWVGPLIWIVPFIIVMVIYHEPNSCWNSETGFSFFYVVPQVLLIFLNFALFINTLRVLKNKLRKSNLADANSSKRYKKLAKSTLLCGFSFSIYYIAFSVWQPFVRGKLPVFLELIRLYFEIICGSFQGLAISCIYCFFNSEVQSEILTQIERKLIRRNPNMRRFSQAPNLRDRISFMSMRSQVNRSTVTSPTKVNNNNSSDWDPKVIQALTTTTGNPNTLSTVVNGTSTANNSMINTSTNGTYLQTVPSANTPNTNTKKNKSSKEKSKKPVKNNTRSELKPPESGGESIFSSPVSQNDTPTHLTTTTITHANAILDDDVDEATRLVVAENRDIGLPTIVLNEKSAQQNNRRSIKESGAGGGVVTFSLNNNNNNTNTNTNTNFNVKIYDKKSLLPTSSSSSNMIRNVDDDDEDENNNNKL